MASKFSKQHYIAIAEVLRNRYASTYTTLQNAADDINDTRDDFKAAEAAHQQVIEITEELVEVFERDNPRFARGPFINVVEGRKALNSRP